MSPLRSIVRRFANVIARKAVPGRKRVPFQPSGEHMEPRAMLSQLTLGLATIVPPRSARSPSAALVFHAHKKVLVTVNDISDQVNVENDITDHVNVENAREHSAPTLSIRRSAG